MSATRSRPSAAVVVVAAGRGERLGMPDKILLPLAGRPMLAHVLDAVEGAAVDGVVLVVGGHTRAAVEKLVVAGPWRKIGAIVPGGERRQDSVAAGVAAVPSVAEIVVVHDGARPLAPPTLFDRCVAAAAAAGAAIAAVPVADTLKRVEGTRITSTIDRTGLWAAQTPQAFRRALLVDAIARCDDRAVMTDEAGLCEALGIPVEVVLGSPSNLKVTRPEDLPVAEALLRAAATPASSSASSSQSWAEDERSTARQVGYLPGGGAGTGPVRTGIGYDVHRLVPGRRLVLGGVVVPHPLGLDGHSDADVILHALADALLGAAALGDIGRHFPPSDPRFREADSRDLLTQVVRLVAAAGYVPVNVDATLIAEAPRIGPHVPAMRATIAACLGVDEAAVGVKATTNEGMGFVGRAEGVAALATATIAPVPAAPPPGV